jgi:hypothetical protein
MQKEAVTSPRSLEPPKASQQETGQSVPPPIANSENVNMYKVISVVQQTMTELKAAVSEPDKIFAITNTYLTS